MQRTLIDPNPEWDFDFFIHTWDLRDWRTSERDVKTSSSFAEIEEFYSPKSITVEKTRTWNTEPYMKYVAEQRWLKKGPGGKDQRASTYLRCITLSLERTR